MSIGLKIKKIRIDLGFSVKTLANQIGVSRSYLTLIENGERRIPKRLIGNLAKALSLPGETIYEWYFEQELSEVGITDKKSYELIQEILKMTPKEKESLMRVLKDEKIAASPSKK